MISLKRVLMTLIIFVLFISILNFAQAAEAVTLSIDDNILDSEYNPILENERTVAPVRVIAEYLGGTVNWEDSSKTVTIEKGNKNIELVINQSTVKTNEESLQLDTSPRLIDGKTYVPLRFVSEVLDYEVVWNSESKRVELTTPKEDSNQEEDNTGENEDNTGENEDNTGENEDNTGENEDNSDENNTFVIEEITRVRIEDDYAVFIDVDEGVKYQITGLPKDEKYPKDRYVIDFMNTQFNVEEPKLDSDGVLHLNNFGGEYISSARASQFENSPLTARVVLVLSDTKGYPHIKRVDDRLAIYYSSSPQGNTIEPTNPDEQEDDPNQDQEDNQEELELGITNNSFIINTEVESEYTIEGLVEEETEDIYGYISETAVRLRTEPSTAGGKETVETVVGENTKMKVIGQQQGWYEVIYKNQHLWVADWLLSVELEMQRNNVNVRRGPSTSYTVVDNIPRGSTIRVLERQPDWVKVRTESGKEGYIADYLVGLNERLLNGVNQSDSVAQKLEITLKDIHKSDVNLTKLPEIIQNHEIISEGNDTIISITLDQPVAFRHSKVDKGIQIDLGSILQDIIVTEDPGRVTVEMEFDAPTRFIIHQNQLKDNFMLDFLYTVIEEEKEFELEGKIASKVFTKVNNESTEVNVSLGDIGTYKLNTTGFSKNIKLELLSSSLDGKVIALDPGHGGRDSGAPYGGIKESNINLDIALRVRDLLLEKGVIVIMTRDTDKTVTLGERANFANEMNADIAISFHVNSTLYGTASGVETFYYPKAENERLARVLQDSLANATGFRNRGVKQWKELYFTKNTLMPSALLEMGFINNSTERTFLLSETGQDKIAKNIVAAIEGFFLYQ
ncbi:MAG: N-acetylmuramoyl-L-alanine amidase [Clostridia bacterium]